VFYGLGECFDFLIAILPPSVFDCDGTLVDSMPLHYIAWCESLAAHHAPFDFTEERFYGFAGVREQDTVIILNREHGSNIDPDSVAHEDVDAVYETPVRHQGSAPCGQRGRRVVW